MLCRACSTRSTGEHNRPESTIYSRRAFEQTGPGPDIEDLGRNWSEEAYERTREAWAVGWVLQSQPYGRQPGFSRWMVPPAALCVHLVHRPGLRVQRVQPADEQMLASPNRRPMTGLDRNSGGFSRSRSSCSASRGHFRPLGRGGRRARRCLPPPCAGRGFFVSAPRLCHIYGSSIRLRRDRRYRLGIGYILAGVDADQWFPDRPGMANRHGDHGFGGGALSLRRVGVADEQVSDADHVGVAETFIVMGAVYFVFMVIGSILVRVPRRAGPADYLRRPVEGADHPKRRLCLRCVKTRNSG